jgi:hypothetical protein
MDAQIKSLIEHLVELGAEEQELRFWEDIMKDLDDADQVKLVNLLQHEAIQLEALARR